MIKIAKIFSDHMVMQAGKEISVFGRCDKEKISVSLKDENGNFAASVESFVLSDSFMAHLPAFSYGGPYVLTLDDGEETVTFGDVYIGEVWLAGGQSNMELELRNSFNGKAVTANAGSDHTDKNIRFYYTPKVSYVGEELLAEEEKSTWELCTPKNSGKWSAVAYYYARELAEKLGCKVGIIGCNWGGTSASCWISREYLLADDRLKGYINRYDDAVKGLSEEDYLKEYEDYLVYQAEFDKKVGHYYLTAENPNWDEAISLFGESRYPGPMGPRNFTRPAGLYESMLKRVMPYTLKGFIYYQGEEDDNRPYLYGRLLTCLIKQWRDDWGRDDIPFINTMLPVFLDEGEKEANHSPWDNWPFIREAQLNLTKNVKNYYVAVPLETGEYHNIHPLDKKTVGYRLSLQALKNVYGYDIKADGPSFGSCDIKDGIVRISLVNADGGLVIKNESNESLENDFEIAGDDGKYIPASDVNINDFEENGITYNITVSSDQIKDPKYVRYFWKNYGTVKIYNREGIPVAPFRTDTGDGSKANWSRQGKIFED